MSNQVYANNMEVSCKQAAGKSICAFPDVCMTPPQTPATPPGVPIPYPNTGMASDTSDGSTSVQVSGQEVMLKNKSYFKTSTGDEAGAAPMKGVVTHKNMGKVYFNAWSMDVKIEGENVVRNLDITTHNHASPIGNSPTWPYLDAAAIATDPNHPCKAVAEELEKNNCQRHVAANTGAGGNVNRSAAATAICNDGPCAAAMKCVLSPKDPSNCCPHPQPSPPKQTPHHIVPASQFHEKGKKESPLLTKKEGNKDVDKYDYRGAPCLCAEGTSHHTLKHGDIHEETNKLTIGHNSVKGAVTGKTISPSARWDVGEAEAVGAQAVENATNGDCKKECTQHQVRKGHHAMGIETTDKIRPSTAGRVPEPAPTQVPFP